MKDIEKILIDEFKRLNRLNESLEKDFLKEKLNEPERKICDNVSAMCKIATTFVEFC